MPENWLFACEKPSSFISWFTSRKLVHIGRADSSILFSHRIAKIASKKIRNRDARSTLIHLFFIYFERSNNENSCQCVDIIAAIRGIGPWDKASRCRIQYTLHTKNKISNIKTNPKTMRGCQIRTVFCQHIVKAPTRRKFSE